MMFGGRVAEEMIFGEEHVTTGAANDISQATNMARAMVTEYGMSEKLGRLRYKANQEEVFLGHSVAQQQNVSEDTARMIDEETRRIVEEGEHLAQKVLKEHEKDLHLVANALLEYEVLSGDETKAILEGKDLDRPTEPDEPAPPPPPKPTSAVPSAGSGSGDDGMEPQPEN